MLKYISATIALSSLLCGCAGDRIVDKSKSYGADLSQLPVKEVISNLDKAVDDPYHIPSRTTFGKGNLSITDSESLAFGIPIHNIARASGTANLTLGQYIDQYSMAVASELDGDTLRNLRELYTGAVQPSLNTKRPSCGAPIGRWLFWTNNDGTPSLNPPLSTNTVRIGGGENHTFFAVDSKQFSDFVLATYGCAPISAKSVMQKSITGRSAGAGKPKADVQQGGIRPRQPATEIAPNGPALLIGPNSNSVVTRP